MTTGMIAGRRRVRSLMNLPSERRAWRRIVSKSVAPSSAASGERRPDRGLRLLEQLVGLGRVHPAAGDDLGPGDELAGGGVDGDDHDDQALLGEVAPVAQHAEADVADDAVDVLVARGHRPPLDLDAARLVGVVVDPSTSPSSHTSTCLGGTPTVSARRGVVHHVPVLAVHGHEPLGLHEVDAGTSALPATRAPRRARPRSRRGSPRRRRGAASR